MKGNWKPYLFGLATGLALVVVGAYAQQNVTILPSHSLIVNRENQAIPIYSAEPIEIKSSDKSPIHIRSDKPIKIEWSKPQDMKWEYRSFSDAEDMTQTMKSGSVQESLNKLGGDGWELVTAYVFKRVKN